MSPTNNIFQGRDNYASIQEVSVPIYFGNVESTNLLGRTILVSVKNPPRQIYPTFHARPYTFPITCANCCCFPFATCYAFLQAQIPRQIVQGLPYLATVSLEVL